MKERIISNKKYKATESRGVKKGHSNTGYTLWASIFSLRLSVG